MLDAEQINQLYERLDNRFTADELCSILNLSVGDLFDKFFDEIIEINWEELL